MTIKDIELGILKKTHNIIREEQQDKYNDGDYGDCEEDGYHEDEEEYTFRKVAI